MAIELLKNNPKDDGLPLVFLFGGSSIWGAGSPDRLTIPSLLAKELNSNEPRATVFNFGQPGHTQTQEIIYLITLLKSDIVPDKVIFLDGGNDAVLSLNYHKLPDAHFNYGGIKATFSLDFPSLVAFYVSRSNIYKLLKSFSFNKKEFDPKHVEEEKRKFLLDNKKLIEQSRKNILRNYKLIDALATEYNFEFKIYLQPTLASKRNLSIEEEKMLKQYGHADDMFAYFAFHNLYKGIDFKTYSNLINLSKVFDDYDKTTFIDQIHYSPFGTSIIAKEMAENLEKELPVK